MNQRALKLEKSTKYARSFPEKAAAQMNQLRHLEATGSDFTARKTASQRGETSTVFPDKEEK